MGDCSIIESAPAPHAPLGAAPFSAASLSGLLDAYRKAGGLSLQKLPLLWVSVFQAYEEDLGGGRRPEEARAALCSLLLQHAPHLAESREALLKNFVRKYDRWVKGGRSVTALEDQRLQAKRPQDYPLSDEEWRHLLALAARYHNVSLAWREFLASGVATPEVKEHFWRDPHVGPVQVPRWIRNRLKYDADNQQDDIRGPRTRKLNGAFNERDPMTLASGDSDQSDDLTLPLVWWAGTPQEIWCGQGQLLVWIDERSWKILAWRLIAHKSYSGFSIRNSWTHKVKEWGLPRKRVHVEMGIWRDAKVFAGSRGPVGTEETELGIRRLGIRLQHATLPRGKVIERLYGSFQDLLHLEPGYAGRNQMIDSFEAIKQQKALVDGGKAHPSEFFLSRDQLMDRIQDLVIKLNRTVKYGEYHKKWIGNKCLYLSPDEAYEEFFTTPLVKIPDSCRHLFQCNKMEETVGPNGISFVFGKRKFTYKDSAELGRLKGQKVVCWFDPEDPSLLSVTDLDGQNPITVPREPPLSHSATPEEMARAETANARFDSYHREVSRTLKPIYKEEFRKRMFRPAFVEVETLEASLEMQRQRAALKQTEREQRMLVASGDRAFGQLGMNPGGAVRCRPESVAAAGKLVRLISEDTEDPSSPAAEEAKDQ
jgi:hypothetical protein